MRRVVYSERKERCLYKYIRNKRLDERCINCSGYGKYYNFEECKYSRCEYYEPVNKYRFLFK